MGGSLGLALKASKDMEVEIVGFSQRPETVKRAKECGAIDQGAADLVFAVQGADIVVIATPVMVIKDVLQKISSHLPPGCIVTDTGSTKTQVMQWADDFLPRTVYFIGGHPMAGKETSGINESEPDLYHGCIYCLTPAPGTTLEALHALEEMVKAVDAKPLLIDAELHDNLVAGISHLPMLLSAAFVSATIDSPAWPKMAKLAASGYRDLSRLASGSPEMNSDICFTNREEIIRWIDCYIEELEKYRHLVRGDYEELKVRLARAQEAREKWLREEEW